MQLIYRGFGRAEELFVQNALDAVKYVESLGHEGPVLVGYTPVARVNPYQALLYSSFEGSGIAHVPLINPSDFDQLIELSRFSRQVILHIHWHSFILAGAKTHSEANEKLSHFRKKMRRFREGGGKVIWTVHNILPHDAVHVDLELELQQFIADEASLIHVMSRRTLDAMESTTNLNPTKIVDAPHPGYVGAYEDFISRHEARITFGIDSDEIVYVLMGAIKGYKGTSFLLDAFNYVLENSDRPRRLIVAGRPDDDRATQAFISECRRHPYVLLDDRKIPSNLVQYYMRAADIALVPYTRALNSGAALLGPSFGLPVVASAVGSLPEVLPGSIAEFSFEDNARSLAAAMTRADRLWNATARTNARRFAESLDARTISADFASQILERA